MIMSNIPGELRYTHEHIWLKIEGAAAYMGITDYVQEQLGSIMYVDLPAYGDTIMIGDNFTEVEASKATLEAPSPLTGQIIEVNEMLDDSPEVINEDAYGSWIVKLKFQDETELDDLLDASEYRKMIKEQQEPLF